MWPTIRRRLARLSTLVTALGLLTACQTHPAPPIAPAELQLARDFPLFTTFWVGPSIRGIPLTAADSKRDYDATVGMRVYYGNCRKPNSILSTNGCQLPLEIATVLYHPHHNDGLGPRREAVIRGVPAEIFNGGASIELYTGHLAIDVYAESPVLAQAAAAALVPLNRSAPLQPLFAPPSFEPGADPRIKAIADRLPPVAPPRPPTRRR